MKEIKKVEESLNCFCPCDGHGIICDICAKKLKFEGYSVLEPIYKSLLIYINIVRYLKWYGKKTC